MWTFNFNGHGIVWPGITVDPLAQIFLVVFLVLTVFGAERTKSDRAVRAALTASLVFPAPVGTALFVFAMILWAIVIVRYLRRG